MSHWTHDRKFKATSSYRGCAIFRIECTFTLGASAQWELPECFLCARHTTSPYISASILFARLTFSDSRSSYDIPWTSQGHLRDKPYFTQPILCRTERAASKYYVWHPAGHGGSWILEVVSDVHMQRWAISNLRCVLDATRFPIHRSTCDRFPATLQPSAHAFHAGSSSVPFPPCFSYFHSYPLLV